MRTEYGHYLGHARGWAVVNTQPHKEQLAFENLQRQDYRAYCPLIRRRRSHARKTSDVLRPLFPGYLFVRIDPETERWRPILSTHGVRRLIRCGDRLSLLEDSFVRALRAREIDGAIARPARPYGIGQEVRLAGGAFDGLAATIVELREPDRLTVLTRLLNQAVKVKVDERQISPV